MQSHTYIYIQYSRMYNLYIHKSAGSVSCIYSEVCIMYKVELHHSHPWCCVLFVSGVVMEGDGPKPSLCTSELVLAVE